MVGTVPQAVNVWWGMTGGLVMDWVTRYEDRNGAGGVVEKQGAEIQEGAEAQTFGVVWGEPFFQVFDEAQSGDQLQAWVG